MGCDATTLKDFRYQDPRYIAAPGYAPQDPALHGGSVYGEKMWIIGAASNVLARVLGDDDECCGFDHSSTGCGKCLLVQNPDSVNSDWTAVIMKKSACPPESAGCGGWNAHFDLAVPGFDNTAASTANVCSVRRGTLFNSKKESAIMADWPSRATY